MTRFRRSKPRTESVLDRPNFRPATAGTVGLEDEVIVVDPVDFSLVHGIDGILTRARWRGGSASREISDSVIELISPIAPDVQTAVDAIKRLRGEAITAGATLMSAPLHPTAAFGDIGHTPGERYGRIADQLRGIMRQTPHCGVHVHVGMPDADSAIRAHNGMRKWLPLLVGLGANSPYWHGRDSGLASARQAIARSLPRSGPARSFKSWDDYVATVRAICAAGDLGDYTEIWWDLRPHPRLGTLEVRALDAQTSIADLRGLVALIHGLALHEAQAAPTSDPAAETLDESIFRALRDGRNAIFEFDGRLQRLEAVAAEAIALAGAALARSGAVDALGDTERMRREGNGAERQREAYKRGGMPAVLTYLVRRTRGDLSPLPDDLVAA